jgi:anaerobic magnesium-protoporphyrin IX monomethyl ester cyclase
VGGRYATTHVNELFGDIPRIDGIVRGHGEEIAREIVQKGISSDIEGLSFRLNDKIVHNKNRKLEPVRSDFYPNRALRRYKYPVAFDGFTSDIQIDLMLGSRGCPYNCNFCDFKFNPLGEKRNWSIRTPESIVSEIRTTEADVIGFADDIFTADMNWVDRVCDLIIKEGIKKKYFINARLEVAKRPDVLKRMYKAGFLAFLLGVESAQDKTLVSMNKGFSTAKVREYFEVLRKFNFIYHCYFIIGNIGETKDEMLDIANFSHELGVDTLGLSILRATKYSGLKEMLKELDDYHIEEESGKVYSDMISLGELQQIRREVYASFFTIPGILRVLKKLVIHRLLTFGRACRIIAFVARKKMRRKAKGKAALLTQKA